MKTLFASRSIKDNIVLMDFNSDVNKFVHESVKILFDILQKVRKFIQNNIIIVI